MNKVIIFGIKDFAALAYYYLKNDSKYEVVAFSINKKYIKSDTFQGLPVVAFENIENKFSPKKFNFFAPISGSKINKNRERIYTECKEKGYHLISYISSKAILFDNKIGENCFILENNTIQPFVNIGNNVIMWSGNHIGHHSIIKNNVFFTSHVVLSGNCIVENNCWLGVNATIRDSSHLKEGTLIAMGATLTIPVTEPWSIYMGTPATKILDKSSNEV